MLYCVHFDVRWFTYYVYSCDAWWSVTFVNSALSSCVISWDLIACCLSLQWTDPTLFDSNYADVVMVIWMWTGDVCNSVVRFRIHCTQILDVLASLQEGIEIDRRSEILCLVVLLWVKLKRNLVLLSFMAEAIVECLTFCNLISLRLRVFVVRYLFDLFVDVDANLVLLKTL